ncbi:hypothetical protein EON65_00860 [archaeon]|nr:MAG: hypothetical protein EON65_00860 [archaeon]
MKTQLVDDNDQLRHTVLNLGDQLNKKSAEVSQLEENLKDKIRKCQAWEKVCKLWLIKDL